MTTARDVETARAIAEDIYNTTSQSQRNDEYDKYQRKAFYALVSPLIAAALSERERETVERCVLIAGKTNCAAPNDIWSAAQKSIVENIRADAARREMP